jgi:hypothetical protein
MFEMFEQNIKKKDILRMKKMTKNVDIVISNDKEKFDTNKKNDWINNDLNESNDLKEFKTLQELKNIEFTNEVNE